MSNRENPRSLRIKRPYTNHIDVRSAIVHLPEPIHFEPRDNA